MMKTILDLEKIKAETLAKIDAKNSDRGIRVVVGMATCGIAAGAQPVLEALYGRSEKKVASKRDGIADGLHRRVPAGAAGGSHNAWERQSDLCESDTRYGAADRRRTYRERKTCHRADHRLFRRQRRAGIGGVA